MELDQEGIWRKSILDNSRMQSPGMRHLQGLNEQGVEMRAEVTAQKVQALVWLSKMVAYLQGSFGCSVENRQGREGNVGTGKPLRRLLQ